MVLILTYYASMRPPEFTGGKFAYDSQGGLKARRASMRPPEFTGGKPMGG